MIWSVKNCTASSKNPLFYNINKVEQGEAEIIAVRNFADDKFGTIYRTLLERDAMAIRTEKPSVHMVLSCDKGENLTDDQAVELIEKNLGDADIAEQPLVVFRHDDTKHKHFHVVSTKIRENGKSIVWNGIGKRLVNSLTKYQQEYGYAAGQDLREKKKSESVKQQGLEFGTLQLFRRICQTAVNVEEIRDALSRDGIRMTEFTSKHTGETMIRLSRPHNRPVYVSARQVAVMRETLAQNKRIAAEKLSKEPEVFVIHGKDDATLFLDRHLTPRNSMDIKLAKLYEAARSILSFKTWGASIIEKDPDEFVRYAVNGQQFGTVKFDIEKARFVGENRPDGMIENPEEVIQFADHNGQSLDLFTPEFWDEWNRKLTNLREWLAIHAKKTQSVEKKSTPVEQKPQPAPTPQPVAKLTFEVIREFRRDDYRYRIKKERDGTMKLQRLEPDKRSPVVNRGHSGYAWYNKASFTSYKDVGHDADGIYFKISDTTGKTRYIDQNGNDLNQTKKKQLGLVSKGYGGPSM